MTGWDCRFERWVADVHRILPQYVTRWGSRRVGLGRVAMRSGVALRAVRVVYGLAHGTGLSVAARVVRLSLLLLAPCLSACAPLREHSLPVDRVRAIAVYESGDRLAVADTMGRLFVGPCRGPGSAQQVRDTGGRVLGIRYRSDGTLKGLVARAEGTAGAAETLLLENINDLGVRQRSDASVLGEAEPSVLGPAPWEFYAGCMYAWTRDGSGLVTLLRSGRLAVATDGTVRYIETGLTTSNRKVLVDATAGAATVSIAAGRDYAVFVASGVERYDRRARGQEANDIAWARLSSDGALIALATNDGWVRVRDTASGALVYSEKGRSPVDGIEFRCAWASEGDQEKLAFAGERGLEVVDVRGRTSQQLRGRFPGTILTADRSGRSVLCSEYSPLWGKCTLTQVLLSSGERRILGCQGRYICAYALSPDGAFLLTGNETLGYGISGGVDVWALRR